MAFDITRLTDAVNKHLNSISDISAMVKQASAEVENRTRFSAELSEAIRQNIQDHMATEEFQSLQSLQEVSKSFAASTESDSSSSTSRELTTKELQDLSKSKYFSVNLVQNALYNSGNSDDESDGSTTDLTKSLLPNYSDNIAAALTGSAVNTTASGNVVKALISSENSNAALSGEDTKKVISELLGTSDSGNDYTKALLTAYSSLKASDSGSSVFGDFQL